VRRHYTGLRGVIENHSRTAGIESGSQVSARAFDSVVEVTSVESVAIVRVSEVSLVRASDVLGVVWV